LQGKVVSFPPGTIPATPAKDFAVIEVTGHPTKP
jgi:hypothetical protein